MGHFFTPRQLALMGLKPKAEEPAISTGLPPRCCPKAVVQRCYCEALGWKCTEHGDRMSPCTGLTHD